MPGCPFCHHENAADADRCARCGAGLSTIEESRDAEHAQGDPAAANNNPDSPLETRLAELLTKAGKIEAIKFFRSETGAGLAEAKQAVETFARQRGISPKPAGCGATAAAILLLGTALCAGVVFALL